MTRTPPSIQRAVPRAKGYLSSRLALANSELDERRIERDIELNIAPHLPGNREAQILEIGFGLGSFLDFVAAAGYRRYEGVDVDPECFELVSQRHPVQLVESASNYLTGKEQFYDAIVMRNVIAHLGRHQAVELTSRCRRALSVGGIFVLQTFNAALASGSYTLANDLTHRVAYTEHSLRQLLLLGGFDVISVRPVRPAMGRLRGRLFALLRAVYCHGVRARYAVERGLGGNPTIYSKELIAVATKS